MKIRTPVLAATAMGLAMVAGPQSAFAFKKTVRAASCFPENLYFSKHFLGFIKDVNAAAKGWKIRFVGGAPKIGSPFTLVQNMTKGVYDMVSCTGAYYQNVLPEADAFKMLEHDPATVRKNGGYAYMQKLHNAKNMQYIARIHSGMPFHLYLRKGKKIDKPNLKGLHLRVAPIYRNFFISLGATVQRSNLAQVYTYMENGTVDGYGWPVAAVLPDWYKVTEYRVDPGFYDADIHVLVNLRTWRRLSAAQRTLINQIGEKWEKLGRAEDQALVAKARAQQAKKGLKVIAFTGKEREFWLKQARDAGWSGLTKVSPTHGPALRKLYAKE